MEPAAPDPRPVVLFDGVCNVCNAAVNFIIDRDAAGKYAFASLQSDVGKKLLAEHGVPPDLDTIALVEDGAAYTHSEAVLRVAKGLDGAWPLLFSLVVLPRPVRDAAYRYFAKNRYAWFGKRESCRVPTPDVRRRFLD
ncbi:MAG TPA: thiol-disulfide oxidoreductase DCC family protein [Polyangiaceae bacterium]|nr:thiol-disulfide oxidoreductase DCC family protein [Polyangiaceae bacterium]